MPNQVGLALLLRKLRSFGQFPLVDKLLFPLVFVLLGLARAAILLLPFRSYSRLFGLYHQTGTFTPVLTSPEVVRVRRVGRIVRATANVTPWESLCLVQALVASLLLRFLGLPYILHFGLAKNTDPQEQEAEPMKAHAWVTAGPIAVTGGRSLSKFTVVGSYVAPCLNREWYV